MTIPTAAEVERDAARYRVLRNCGAAPGGTLHLDEGYIMVASSLDAWADGVINSKPIMASHVSEGLTDGSGSRRLPDPPSVSVTTNGTRRMFPAAEPVFLIRGQDIVSGDAVRAWADLAEKAGAAPDIIRTAHEQAAKMDAWPKKKVADLPKESTP